MKKFRSLGANRLMLFVFILLLITSYCCCSLKSILENYVSAKERSTKLKTEIELKHAAIEELQHQLKALKLTYPLIKPNVVARHFETILQFILSSDLSLESYEPMPDRKHAFYTERSYAVAVTGNFVQLVQLIDKIQSMDALFMCDDFKMKKNNSSDKQQMKLIIKAFSDINSALSPKKSFCTLKQVRNQLKPKVSIQLANFSLSALHFVGFMRQKNKIFALLTAPDGSISLVKTGDAIGTSHGKIILIKDKRIHIREKVFVGRESSKITTLQLT